MRINQASINQANSRRAGSKRTGRPSAAIAVLLLAALGGCATHRPMSVASYATSGAAYPAINQDDWLTAANADIVVNAMAAKGLMPATIDCRIDNSVPGQVAYGSKFTWKRASAKARYHWEVGDPTYLASKEVKANRVGLRRIFAKNVHDPVSGQMVGCSIWTN